MPKNTVVITGGNGFVGRYLVDELKAWADKIIVWDKNLTDISADIEGVEVDITKPQTYQQSIIEVQPDWVVHLAGIASVPYAMAHPDEVRQVNVEGARMLLETIKQYSPASAVLVVSSADIYGQSSSVPTPELPLTECQPGNAYAKSKWEMERVIEQSFLHNVMRVRPYPHIGPGQQLGFVVADFASQITAIEAGKQKPIIKVGNLTTQRDFTDVRDVVRAYRLLMEKGMLGEVYNVASGKPVQIQTILNTLLNLTKVNITIEQDPRKVRPVDTSIVVGNADKLKQSTGWQVEISLEKSLRDILNYWRSRTS